LFATINASLASASGDFVRAGRFAITESFPILVAFMVVFINNRHNLTLNYSFSTKQ
jgi:hypothetical protein